MIHCCFNLNITILITDIRIVTVCTIALEKQVHTNEHANKLSNYVIKDLLNVWKLWTFRILSMIWRKLFSCRKSVKEY